MEHQSLKWSANFQLSLSPTSTSTRREGGQRLHGDKITLPQSALEALLAAAPVVAVTNQNVPRFSTAQFDPFNPYSFAAERQAREALAERQQQLPHPLTFRLVNPANGRVVYAGIREFSAEEGSAVLSPALLDALGYVPRAPDEELRSRVGTPGGGADVSSTLISGDGILNGDATSTGVLRNGIPNGDAMVTDVVENKSHAVTVHAHQLARGTYVRLRPLEAGYDPEDWKSLLERYLRDNYTTLTKGVVLNVPGARHEYFKFLVDKFEPEGDGICIVDTDLEVDIEALNEEQARETLNRRAAKSKRAPRTTTGSSAGGPINVAEPVTGQVLPGEYVDYELKKWNRTEDLEVRFEAEEVADLDIFVNPFSDRQRGWPRLDDHVFGDLASRPIKRLKLSHTNVHLEEAETMHISVHAPNPLQNEVKNPLRYSIIIVNPPDTDMDEPADTETQPGPEEVRCKNCQQIIPKRTLPLHEAFCYRNNVACPQCKNVFLKSSDAWKTHWHCPHDEAYGDGEATHAKHDHNFHPSTPLRCPACEYEAYNIPILAQHRTTTCPAKEILCQFCHLIVPQQGLDDPAFTDAEVLLSGLTPHEVRDGSRTTECHLCGKIVKLQNMKTHLKLHDRDRILRPKPRTCINAICGRVIKAGKETQSGAEQLGLCDECFGPLYGTAYDPEGKALRRRIERRLLQQVMGGCGKPWCRNAEWCRTGRKNATGQDVVMTARDALPVVKPILDLLVQGDSSKLRFCTDESSQIRRSMAELIAAEGVYELEWCMKALEEAKNDLGRARDWLKDMAPKRDEVVA